ncbi:MAG: hypothetical protein ABIM74_05615 [candidate division WOR-3 bacterium]
MTAFFFLRPYIGLMAGLAQASDGSGMGMGIEGGLWAGNPRARLTLMVSYSKLSVEGSFDTTATPAGGGDQGPSEVPATRSLDAIDLALGPSICIGRSEIGLRFGSSLHTGERVSDDAGYTLKEYPSTWSFLWGGGFGWNWDKFGLWFFADQHTGRRGLWVFGAKARLFPL